MKNILALLVLLLLFSGCATSTDISNCSIDDPYGFLSGIWHGMITPFSFIGSLFSESVSVYAKNNTGGWYDFGFLLGVGGLSFGSSKSSR